MFSFVRVNICLCFDSEIERKNIGNKLGDTDQLILLYFHHANDVFETPEK